MEPYRLKKMEPIDWKKMQPYILNKDGTLETEKI